MNSCEILFWGGIVIMAASIVSGVVALAVFCITGRKLKRNLEKEYGRPEL